MTVALPELLKIDHSKRPLIGNASVLYKPDTAKYESIWVPKINAYRKALQDAIPKELLIPKGLIPEDLDNTVFDPSTIPAKVLDSRTLELTELSAVEIAAKIKDKSLTAVEILTAFFKRAVIATQLTDCVMEIVYEDGLERAKYLDKYYEETGKLIGPLHGVPISLKEHYNFKGHVTHAGFVSNLDNVSPEFSTTNQILYDLGATFYVRTNEPQCLMHLDSINNITPRCKNSHNTAASPGGSSSGEGALIGMKGSALGVGSDIGGSIRAPSAFNGIWGLKPTAKRISLMGCPASHEHTLGDIVPATLGPMSNTPEDLDLFMEAYLSTEPWEIDQQLVPIPWKKVEVPKPQELTIAIAFDDGVVKPHPPIVRALEELKTKLGKAGVNVITWEPHRVYETVEIAYAGYTSDGNYSAIHKMAESGEPTAPLTDTFLSFGQGDRGLPTIESEEYTFQREVLRQEYLELMNDRKVDFIIAPTNVSVAPKPSTVKYWGYTALWNLLDQTCVTFPSNVFVDKEIDVKDELYEPRNEYEEYEYGLYDAEFNHGMPVGLTLVGRRYTDEKAIAASKLIRDIIA